MRATAGCLVALALLAGCGGGNGGGEGPPTETVTRPERPPREPGLGALLTVELERQGRGTYIEGFATAVRVRGGGARPLVDELVRRGEGRLLRRRLEPGRYRLDVAIRPGAGGGERLDPPAERCSAPLALRVGDTATANVLLRPGADCSVRVSSPLDDYVGESVAAARRLARSRGRALRVVERDGEPLAVTRDLRPDRVNVAVGDGRVVRVDGVY